MNFIKLKLFLFFLMIIKFIFIFNNKFIRILEYIIGIIINKLNKFTKNFINYCFTNFLSFIFFDIYLNCFINYYFNTRESNFLIILLYSNIFISNLLIINYNYVLLGSCTKYYFQFFILLNKIYIYFEFHKKFQDIQEVYISNIYQVYILDYDFFMMPEHC